MVMIRIFFQINNTSKTDVAPWCYKWVGGLDGYLRVGVCIEDLTVLINLQKGFFIIFCMKSINDD